jgi:hypothetical protein
LGQEFPEAFKSKVAKGTLVLGLPDGCWHVQARDGQLMGVFGRLGEEGLVTENTGFLQGGQAVKTPARAL